MTDSVLERARPEAAIPYGARLALTVLLVAVYLAGHRVPLPLVEMSQPYPEAPVSRVSLMMLGINPLLIGFVLVELFSLVTSPGRRLRTGGLEGRAKLNRAALAVSLILSGVQALGISMYLEALSGTGGPFLIQSGWGFRILMVMTLAAVTAVVFTLGNLLSEYGIGNGFALLILADTGSSILASRLAWSGEDPSALPAQALGLLLAVGLAAALVRYVQRADSTGTPAFPQGILPAQWAATALSILYWQQAYGSSPSDSVERSTVFEFLMILIAVPVFSWLAFQFFSSRARLTANLPEPEEVVDVYTATLRHRLVPSTALLTIGTAGLFAWGLYRPDTVAAAFGFLEMALVVAIVLDLRDQFLFLRQHGLAVRLVQLDNVHLAYRLAARLRERGIDVLTRAQRLRALYFFFGALIKIDVLVPQEQLAQARDELNALEFSRELEVF